MKMSIATVVMMSFVGILFAETPTLAANTLTNNRIKVERKKVMRTPREQAERHMVALQRRTEHLGGLIEKPNSQKGKILVVNMQNYIPAKEVKDVAETIAIREYLKVEFVNGLSEKITPYNASFHKNSLGANCIVYVIECDECPDMMLIAPEGAWAIINAAAICKGAKNDAFKKARLAKMVERGFYCACGAMNSQYTLSLMAAVTNTEDLDRLANRAPVDVVQRTISNLEAIGVTPKAFFSYKKACEQGWAPAPTNDIQKAIWDKVHQLPTKPIKILPETKPVKE